MLIIPLGLLEIFAKFHTPFHLPLEVGDVCVSVFVGFAIFLDFYFLLSLL